MNCGDSYEELLERVCKLEAVIDNLTRPHGVQIGSVYYNGEVEYVVFSVADGYVLTFRKLDGGLMRHPVDKFHADFTLEVNNEA